MMIMEGLLMCDHIRQ
jgi:hypothetical protein